MHILLINPPNCGRSIPEERYGIDVIKMIFRGEPLALETLAGNLPGHDIAIIDLKADPEGLSEDALDFKPDLILMDVVMPGLNGFQATRQLTSDPETADIPVIIVTRKDQQVDRVWGMRQGASDYVTKPVRENTLVTLINQALAA